MGVQTIASDSLPPGFITQSYLGKNAVGASQETAGTRVEFAKKIVVASAGLLASIDAYLQASADAEYDVFALLYDDNGSATAPKHVLSVTAAIGFVPEESGSGPRAARWVSFPVGSWLAAATYWISMFANGININYDTSGSDLKMTHGVPGALQQAGDWGLWTTATTSRDYSIRANFIR